MKLFCEACQENHEFSTRETELLIYVLQAELATALQPPPDSEIYYEHRRKLTHEELWKTLCLRETLSSGLDAESFGEWCAGMVDARQEPDCIVDCEACGEDATHRSPSGEPYCDKCHLTP